MNKVTFIISVILFICVQMTIAQEGLSSMSSLNIDTHTDISNERKNSIKKILQINSSNYIIKNNNSFQGPEFQGLFHGINHIKKLYDMYNLNICQYYGLKEYDTELKEKVFKETTEGKQLTDSLKKEKQKIVSSKLYYIFPFKANSGWNKKYNLKTRTFDFSYIVNEYEFIPIQGYINFPQLIIKCNPTIKQHNEKRYNSNINRYSYLNTIKIPMSETIALPIEENIDDMALVIEFKIQQMKYTSREAAIFLLKTYCIQGVSTNIYIIDKNTNEIYFSL